MEPHKKKGIHLKEKDEKKSALRVLVQHYLPESSTAQHGPAEEAPPEPYPQESHNVRATDAGFLHILDEFPWLHLKQRLLLWESRPSELEGCVKLVGGQSANEIVRQAITWENPECPVLLMIEDLTRRQGWKFGRPKELPHKLTDTTKVMCDFDWTDHPEYYRTLYVLPGLFGRGLQELYPVQTAAYYKCVRTVDDPGEVKVGLKAIEYAKLEKAGRVQGCAALEAPAAPPAIEDEEDEEENEIIAPLPPALPAPPSGSSSCPTLTSSSFFGRPSRLGDANRSGVRGRRGRVRGGNHRRGQDVPALSENLEARRSASVIARRLRS